MIVKTNNSVYIVDAKNKQIFRRGDAHWKVNYEALEPIIIGRPLIATLSNGNIFRTSLVEKVGMNAL